MPKLISYIFIIYIFSACQSAWKIKPENFLRSYEHEILKNYYKNNTGLVVILWQRSCPCVKRYEERVRNLYKKYKKLGIEFVYLSSNTNETFEQAQAEYSTRNMPLIFIHDEEGHFAKAAQAKSTPTVLLLNKEGDIVYMGWIDNERREGEKKREAYLENALEEYLLGNPITIKTSPIFGCAIR
jgi:thioredoxin-related protein